MGLNYCGNITKWLRAWAAHNTGNLRQCSNSTQNLHVTRASEVSISHARSSRSELCYLVCISIYIAHTGVARALLKMGRYYSTIMCHCRDMSVK